MWNFKKFLCGQAQKWKAAVGVTTREAEANRETPASRTQQTKRLNVTVK